MGEVTRVRQEGTNVHFTLRSPVSADLQVDQSLSHDGVCLTVVDCGDGMHTVTAVEETLRRSNLRQWRPGSLVNLERAMRVDGRLDGHIVQGHVDTTGTVTEVRETGGSWHFGFRYGAVEHVLVDKGSVTVNGVSLTVVMPGLDTFGVAIIPYTYEHTNFGRLAVGDVVNLEFDIIGKYIARLMKPYGGSL
jgi:riboflavin synthase